MYRIYVGLILLIPCLALNAQSKKEKKAKEKADKKKDEDKKKK